MSSTRQYAAKKTKSSSDEGVEENKKTKSKTKSKKSTTKKDDKEEKLRLQKEALQAKDATLISSVVNNTAWEENMAAFRQYQQIYDHVNVPETSIEYPKLGAFAQYIRFYQGALPSDKKQQLQDIGFTLKDPSIEMYDRKWQTMLERLVEYKDKHGDCRVPARYLEDKKLGNWVAAHRGYYRRNQLEEDRIEKLNEIGFIWRIRENSSRASIVADRKWETRFQELLDFHKDHGHFRIPRIYEPNPALGRWVSLQRRLKKGKGKRKSLRVDREKRLSDVSFLWDFEERFEESWETMFQKEKEVVQQFALYEAQRKQQQAKGAFNTRPRRGSELLNWIQTQKVLHAKGELRDHRKAKLDSIGFDFRIKTRRSYQVDD